MMDPVVTIFPALQEKDEPLQFVDPAVAVGVPDPLPLPPPAPEEEDLIDTDIFAAPSIEPELPEEEPVVGPNIPGEGANLADTLL